MPEYDRLIPIYLIIYIEYVHLFFGFVKWDPKTGEFLYKHCLCPEV